MKVNVKVLFYRMRNRCRVWLNNHSRSQLLWFADLLLRFCIAPILIILFGIQEYLRQLQEFYRAFPEQKNVSQPISSNPPIFQSTREDENGVEVP